MRDRLGCPYCNKEDFIPDYVYGNIEAYGSRGVRFRCKFCQKVVSGIGQRIVRVSDIQKSDKEPMW